MGAKTDDGSIHDKDNEYKWSANLPGGGYTSKPDGSAFTDFVATLNGFEDGECFASTCDWRIPTLDELVSINDLTAPGCDDSDFSAPCTTIPGEVGGADSPDRGRFELYWASNTFPGESIYALANRFIGFAANGSSGQFGKPKDWAMYVRAVRGVGSVGELD